jgi:hypothetical protein
VDDSLRTPHTDPLVQTRKASAVRVERLEQGVSGPFPRETATCPQSWLLLRKRLRRRSPVIVGVMAEDNDTHSAVQEEEP